MKGFSFKFPQVSHIGNTVSHAKNRKKRAFKYNLHTVTVMIGGKKQRMRVPTKILRMLKKSGQTTHYKSAEQPVKVVKSQVVIQPKMAIKDQPKVETKVEVKVETKSKAKAKPKAKVKPKAKAKKK
jgi:ribosomal protein L28